MLVTGRFLVRLGFGLLILLPAAAASLAEPLPCRAITHEGSDYTVCEIDLRRQVVNFFWKRADGHPYGYLSSLPHELGNRSGRLLFATNAGMYNPDYRPVGLYVENGRELVRANTRTGPGNFHMKPNGVLYVAGHLPGSSKLVCFLSRSRGQTPPPSRGRCWSTLWSSPSQKPRFPSASLRVCSETSCSARALFSSTTESL